MDRDIDWPFIILVSGMAIALIIGIILLATFGVDAGQGYVDNHSEPLARNLLPR
jgi:hypothetical protein